MDTCWRCLLDIASYYHEQECLAGARRHEEQLLVIDEYQAKRPRLVQECESFESSFMDVSNCSQKAGEEVVGPWNLSKQSSECNLQETAEVNCSLVLDTPRSTRRFPKRRLFPNQRGTAHKKFDYLSLVNVPLA
ncbi:hypothetical protein NQ315_007405 [Exocentrus adspersus]|uniref:Uncharacterized protein n=1 Tax=Exocentrus adspersus TaxID=1586481 RepID=A0AAV8VHJ6_9CUCU|nr:hypothetical protein NQ315_007405 [Exocentrus adspersus]